MKNTNKEFLEITHDIINNETFKTLNNYKHHYIYTRLEHSISVSYYSYKITKLLHLDYTSTARAALLHDLFLYECKNKQTRTKHHIKQHPKIALKNAQKLFTLNNLEKDIILNHMWPLTFTPPKHLESLIVTFIDKYCAFKEWKNYCTYNLSKINLVPPFPLPI